MSEAGTPATEAARIILEGGAVHVRTDGEPFFFSSGWASPVFIDLKRLISDPDARGRLIELMLDGISTAYGDAFEQVAGCELAGVPFATLTAHRLDLPLVIALKQARGFDRLSQCEGTFDPGAKTLLVDDLTTDGKTKANFKAALERAQANVVGIYVILNYGIFPSPGYRVAHESRGYHSRSGAGGRSRCQGPRRNQDLRSRRTPMVPPAWRDQGELGPLRRPWAFVHLMDEVVSHLFSEGRACCDVGRVVPEVVRLVGIVREVIELAPVLIRVDGVAPVLAGQCANARCAIEAETRHAVVVFDQDGVVRRCRARFKVRQETLALCSEEGAHTGTLKNSER